MRQQHGVSCACPVSRDIEINDGIAPAAGRCRAISCCSSSNPRAPFPRRAAVPLRAQSCAPAPPSLCHQGACGQSIDRVQRHPESLRVPSCVCPSRRCCLTALPGTNSRYKQLAAVSTWYTTGVTTPSLRAFSRALASCSNTHTHTHTCVKISEQRLCCQ